MNRLTAALTLLAIATTGCAKAGPGTAAPATAAGADYAPAGYGGEGGGASMASYESGAATAAYESDGATAAAEATPMAMDEEAGAMLRMAELDDTTGFDPQINAGRLTAGSFDDTLNPQTFASFLVGMRSNPAVSRFAQTLDGTVTVIEVVDEVGRPIADAPVMVGSGQQGSVERRTGTDGRVVLLGGWDYDGRALEVGVGQQGRTDLRAGGHARIVAPELRHRTVRALDLALVVDATGSMSDELEYLKVELRNIAKEVKAEFPQVDQRFGLVVYRDHGDEYVTRKFDFSADLSRFERRLGRQTAGGGGDYPEAMDVALQDAADLRWHRGADTARVAFVIADAPPHTRDLETTTRAIQELRAENVAIYPIAASGVAAEAELVMRTAAAASGGQYLFLTDDSGVGNSHAEPHVPCYDVESLRDAMARMLVTELSGKHLSSDSRHAIRTIGQSNEGVCAPLTIAQ